MSRRLIVCAGRETREFVLVGTIVVGRDPACDISDAGDPLLSRRHAEFSNAGEAMVRDLGSRNGILVNGVKTPQAVLRAGDVVQVGQLQVKFVDELGPFMDVPGAQPATAPAVDATNAATVVLDHPTFPPLDLDVTKKLP
jgi:pSer/pThr/pTyr-binding forkhead associated (FHA) protein